MTCEFHALLVDELPRMGKYALTLTHGNHALADDLLQETALKACRAQGQFVVGTNFKAWIWRILRNEYIAIYRHQRKAPRPMEGLDETFFSREGDQESKAMSREAFQAFGKLSEDRRAILLLQCWDDLCYEDIAKLLGCPVGTVRSRISRARRDLHRLMEDNVVPQTRKVPPSDSRIHM